MMYNIDDVWDEINSMIGSMDRDDTLFEICPRHTALIVIDMQSAFCSPTGCLENSDARDIVPNINRISEKCRTNDIPVIWLRLEFDEDLSDAGLWPLFQPTSPYGTQREDPPTALSDTGTESDIWDGLHIDREKDYEIKKCRYSPFISGSSRLERLLSSMGVDTLIFTGVATNVCCETAARDAMMLDYSVVFVRDTNATFHPLLHEVSLMNIKLMFGDVINTDELLNRIES